MNRSLLIISFAFFFQGLHSQSVEKEFPKSFSIKVTNPDAEERENAMAYVSQDQLLKWGRSFNANAFVVMDGDNEIPSQYNFNDRDYPGLVFVLENLAAKQSRNITIRYNLLGTIRRAYVKRTQAELSHKEGGKFVNREYVGGEFKNVDFLRVPVEHKDHSWFIRYEGPGWESDKVAYRFYLDERDATDVFGKITSEMVLQQVGLDGFDSYHERQSWGMDVMKVGKSLGLGTLGTFVDGHAIRVDKTDSVDCRITENGNVFSSIQTNYYGWQVNNSKYNVVSRLKIHSGTRLTHQLITVNGIPDNLCTGLVKDKEGKLLMNKGDKGHWGYIATYGKQSLNGDNLGIAVFFRPTDLIGFTEDEFSHVVKLSTSQGRLDYYFQAAWELEHEGIKNEKEFSNYLNQVAIELAAPLLITIDKYAK